MQHLIPKTPKTRRTRTTSLASSSVTKTDSPKSISPSVPNSRKQSLSVTGGQRGWGETKIHLYLSWHHPVYLPCLTSQTIRLPTWNSQIPFSLNHQQSPPPTSKLPKLTQWHQCPMRDPNGSKPSSVSPTCSNLCSWWPVHSTMNASTLWRPLVNAPRTHRQSSHLSQSGNPLDSTPPSPSFCPRKDNRCIWTKHCVPPGVQPNVQPNLHISHPHGHHCGPISTTPPSRHTQTQHPPSTNPTTTST